MADIILYTPDKRAAAHALLDLLPENERIARRLELGVRHWDSVPMRSDKTKGTMLTRCQYGTPSDYRWYIRPENVKWSSPEPGIDVGEILSAAYDDAWKAREEKQKQADAFVAAKRHQRTIEAPANAEHMRLRYMLAVARLAGLARPEKLPADGLEDVVLLHALRDSELPSLDVWLTATGATFEEIQEAPFELKTLADLDALRADAGEGYVSQVVKRPNAKG